MIYVMSDIHGHYDEYLQMLEKVNFSEDDTLYIVGDLIDKGPKSGSLLLSVMNQPNVVFLLGNHELMMMNALTTYQDMLLWMANGADETINQIEAVGLEYVPIVSWLKTCPILIPQLKVNNTYYHLCHAGFLNSEKRVEGSLYYSDVSRLQLKELLWNRDIGYNGVTDYQWLTQEYPNTTFIIGHTPVYNTSYTRYDMNGRAMVSVTPGGLFLNIDCGCAGNRRLGCVCLNNLTEYYVECDSQAQPEVAHGQYKEFVTAY